MDDTIIIFQQRLNEFINKYYLNRFVRGIVFFVIGFMVIFLTSSFIEYFAWASNKIRLFLFLGSILGIVFIFYYFLLIPILRYLRILPQITHKHAITIISLFFPNSKDLLVNILELSYLYKRDSTNSLIIASIFQKIQNTYDFDFEKAVNKSNIFPLLKYLLGLILIYLSILIFNPDIITDGSSRILHYNTFYEKSFGFYVTIDSTELVVEKGKSRRINIKLIGNKYPDYLNLQVNGHEFLLTKKAQNLYTYEFKNVVNTFLFRVVNSYYSSKEFNLRIISPPVISSYSIKIKYPKYLGLNNEYVLDKLSIKAPMGSDIIWNFAANNLDSLYFVIDSINYYGVLKGRNYEIEMKLLKDLNYAVFGSNSFLTKSIYSDNKITVIPDLYPTISISETQDNNNVNLFYYYGIISDDYGFSSLKFVCNNGIKDSIVPIQFYSNNNNQEFYFSIDYSFLPGNEFKSFFVVDDNDELNHFKSTKSNVFYFRKLNYLEMVKESEQKNFFMEQKFEKSRALTEELLRDTKEIKKKLLNENLTSFEKSNLMGDLINKQSSLSEMIKNLSQENVLKNTFDRNISKQEREILEKNDKIQELLDSLLTDELKALFKELERLKEEFNQEKFNEISKDLERNYDELSKQLENNLELLKRIDVENRIYEVVEKLMKLSINQDSISKELIKNTSIDSVFKINIMDQKLAEQLLDQYEKIVEKDNTLEKPINVDSFQNNFSDLKENIEKAISPENSKKQNIDNFEKNSKSANELANDLKKLVDNNSLNQEGEDSESLRQILENLIYFSFEQESINNQFGHISKLDPKFTDMLYSQYNLNDIFLIIKDSLNAVSKRTPYLGNHISKKAFSIEGKLLSIKDYVKEENFAKINLEQRYIIEYSNDLILLLSESLKNLNNMSGSGGGNSKQKNKQKSRKPSLGEMRKNQEGIKEQLEGMIEQMKKGGSKGGSLSTEKLGKMFAQQEIFQQMINQLSGNSGIGKEYSKQLNEISKLLDDNKKDLARMQISQQTINRQQQIVTRLLDAENAENEREIDNIRKSNEAKKHIRSSPKSKFEEDNQITNFEELFNKSSIQLQYFYKNKYQDYINKLNKRPDEKGN